MRRATLSVLIGIISANVMADEFFLGGGYDFYRKGNNGIKKIEPGFKIKAEWLPFESKNFKMGLGIAHEFGFKAKIDGTKTKLGKATPVYAVIKPEWETGSEWKIYNKYKLGWSFNSGKEYRNTDRTIIKSGFKSGLYAGIEVGAEWKNFSFGLSYDMNNKKHQVGLVVGYVFSKEKSYKSSITAPVKQIKIYESPVQDIPVREVPEAKPAVIRVRNRREEAPRNLDNNLNDENINNDSSDNSDLNNNNLNNSDPNNINLNNRNSSNNNLNNHNLKNSDLKNSNPNNINLNNRNSSNNDLNKHNLKNSNLKDSDSNNINLNNNNLNNKNLNSNTDDKNLGIDESLNNNNLNNNNLENSSKINNSKIKEKETTEKKTGTDYRGWFSFDEEINK